MLTQLTDTEYKMLRGGMSPVSTITWFRGNHNRAAAILTNRLLAIVDKNPWLAGRIVKQRGAAFLEYDYKDDYQDDCLDMFCHLTQPIASINRHTPTAQIARRLTKAKILLRARHDMEQPLYKVIVLPTSHDDDNPFFAVVVSMSHIVGDGHTFYSLHNALLGSIDEIPKLDPTRIETTLQQQEEALGVTESNLFSMAAFTLTLLWGYILTKLVAPCPWGKRFRLETHNLEVNPSAMSQTKKHEATNASIPFVSTNDVVTSWFFQKSRGTIGRMAINFRNRLDGHDDTKAGNYENALVYRIPQDTTSPSLIRQSLHTLKRVNTAKEPPCNRELLGARLSLISNWASFAASTPARLEGCQQDIHLPLFDVASLLPTTLALCVVFQAQPNQLGIMVTGTPDRMAGLLEQVPFVAGPLT